jgi:hypothetical protein
MRARRGYLRVFWAAAALSACDSPAVENGTLVAPTPTATALPRAAAPAPVPTPFATPTEVIARIPPAALRSPPAEVVPAAPMRPRRDFVDPPLPSELNDDGGLEPLPPPRRR